MGNNIRWEMIMGTKNIVERIVRLLKEQGDLDTYSLWDKLRYQKKKRCNKPYTRNPTMNSLVNIMSKNKVFVKRERTVRAKGHNACVWGLRDDLQKDE